MNTQTMTMHAVTALLAGAAGWLLNQPVDPVDETSAPRVQVQARPAPVSREPRIEQPLISIASDGRATLRVEQQPLEWVLDQIALQSGWTDVPARARLAPKSAGATDRASVPDPDPFASACPPPDLVTPAVATRTLQAIELGTESDRLDGLQFARSQGVAVPDTLLRTLYETAASDRVRLMALDAYLESRADAAELRSALEAAMYVPNSAVRNEARQRLDEAMELDRIDAASMQGDAR
jgi:hypothetical protein